MTDPATFEMTFSGVHGGPCPVCKRRGELIAHRGTLRPDGQRTIVHRDNWGTHECSLPVADGWIKTWPEPVWRYERSEEAGSMSEVRYRVGRSWGTTVVAEEQGKPDRLMGDMKTREDAALVVDALNGLTPQADAARIAELERLEREATQHAFDAEADRDRERTNVANAKAEIARLREQRSTANADAYEMYVKQYDLRQDLEDRLQAVLEYVAKIECPNCDHAVSFHDNRMGTCDANVNNALGPCGCDWSSSIAEDIRDLLEARAGRPAQAGSGLSVDAALEAETSSGSESSIDT